MARSISFFQQFFRLRKLMQEDYLNAKNKGCKTYYSDKSVMCMKLIWTYMMSCKWHNTDRTKSLMSVVELTDTQAGQNLCISPNTVRSLRSSASARLFNIVGKNCFKTIHGGEEASVSRLEKKLRYLVFGYDNVFEFVPKGIIDSVMLTPRKNNNAYRLSDCTRELAYLARYDFIDMAVSFNNLDEDKLHFIFDVLMNNGNSGNGKEAILFQVLKLQEHMKKVCKWL